MNKIIGFRRSRNGSMLYYIVRAMNEVHVRRCLSWTARSEHCKTFIFTDDASFDTVLRKAKMLTDALCRMSPSETLRQAENIRQHGEVR